ncbi:MAG: heavy metal translocating P-type ATPase [Candidatus Brocadiales bacterium]|nr:heavy metal translocating P-type ATPase [Candidatus Brocadiales bacterium]
MKESQKAVALKVPGMDCQEEAQLIRKKLSSLKGVIRLDILLLSQELRVRYDSDVLDMQQIIKAVEETGLTATLIGERIPREIDLGKRWQLILTTVSGLFTISGLTLFLTGFPADITIPLYLVAMLSGGFKIALKGFRALRALSPDMNFLMTVAVIGAAAIGEWGEAATIIFLFALAQLLESHSIDRARKALRSLMALSPQEALVRRNGEEASLPLEEIQIGETIIIRPSERIPLDGVVVGGYSEVNQAPITGESVPVEKFPGCDVFAGTINREGALEVRVTHGVKDTTLARIIHMVEECEAQKAPYQSFVDRFARIYTPTVIALAFLVAIIPPYILQVPFTPWFYKGLVLLVISCPCALVIATPVSLLSGITCAARNGVLIKGGVHLEEAGHIKVIAFDKTGTLTKGAPEVIDIIPLDSLSHDELLQIAASIEARSEHHLAGAILRRAREDGLKLQEVTNFKAVPGKGASAQIEEKNYWIGNLKLSRELGISTSRVETILSGLQSQGKTVMLVGREDRLLGTITVADDIRKASLEALPYLKQNGIKKILMLTGDNKGTARAIAQKLAVDEYLAELSPEEKVEAVRECIKRHGKTAMVGDGVNDAPAMAVATLGIAMGTAGTDTALETADIALMADDLLKLPFALSLSRRTLKIIKQNIAFALLVKAAFLALVAPGWTTLWMAVGADMGASLLVIFNGLRLLKHTP